jgi:hypothetical protein
MGASEPAWAHLTLIECDIVPASLSQVIRGAQSGQACTQNNDHEMAFWFSEDRPHVVAKSPEATDAPPFLISANPSRV